MKRMIHQVDVMRPTKALDARGQANAEEVVMPNVPCSIEELNGREYEQAHKLYADAQLAVEMYGDPKTPIKATDVLQFGKRRLNVGHVSDKNQNGLQLRLLCSEAR
jgi:head-tail adaptor